MKFTTSDEKEHLNQPIHLCLATLFSCALRFQATPTLRAGTVALKGSGNGLVFGAGGVGSPMIP